jgi:hypothetical protein
MQHKANQRRSIKFTLITLSWLFVLSAGFVQAQIPDRPKSGPDDKKLEVWVGDWQYEGVINDTPSGPGGKYAGKLTCRMTLDDLFLETRAEDKGVYGGKEMVYQGINVQWYDSVTKTYIARGFDNDGIVSSRITTVNGNTWIGTGTGIDRKGKTGKSKSSLTFSSDGKTYTTKGELSTDDGKTWMPWWEETGKRISNTSVEQEIIKLENQWNEAMIKVDTKALSDILADDYFETGDKGELSTKDKFISALKSGELKFSSAKCDDLKVRVYGSAAVVTGRNTTKGEEKGKDISGSSRYTDTWAMRNNRWQCVASQWVKEEKKP